MGTVGSFGLKIIEWETGLNSLESGLVHVIRLITDDVSKGQAGFQHGFHPSQRQHVASIAQAFFRLRVGFKEQAVTSHGYCGFGQQRRVFSVTPCGFSRATGCTRRPARSSRGGRTRCSPPIGRGISFPVGVWPWKRPMRSRDARLPCSVPSIRLPPHSCTNPLNHDTWSSPYSSRFAGRRVGGAAAPRPHADPA